MSSPKMLWHPDTGESRIFSGSETPPADWLDHHPADGNHVGAEEMPDTLHTKAAAAAKLAPADDALPMTRAEIRIALEDAGIAYAKNAKDATLYDLLLTSLRAHLTAENIEFPPNAAAPELLKLVAPPAAE